MLGSSHPARRLAAETAAAAALGAAVGALLGGVPLLEVPGWELGELGALAAAILGAPLGIREARRELAREVPSALAGFGRAAAVLGAGVAGLLAGSALRTAAASPCSPLAGAAFVPAVALPSALLAAALGLLAGAAARGRRLAAGLVYAALAGASLAGTLAEAYFGPAAYALDHLFGAWPGPVYDEALAVGERLVLFRIATLGWTAAIVSVAELALWRGRLLRAADRPAGPPPAGRARRAALALAAAAGAAVAARAAMVWRGDLAGRSQVAAALGGLREGPLCRLHYPAEKAAEEAERLARDCELDALAVAEALALERPRRVTVFVYRTAEEKRRLVGAGRTSFAKPWLAEVHVNDAPSPDPVLRHELAHALASAFARGPLGVPARAGVLVEAGLVEGLAMAVEPPRGDWTVHEWARAMRDLGLMPPAASLVGAADFLAAPPARAYAAAGSFLRFLLERRGPGPVKSVYGGASFESAFGRPLGALVAEWSAFLDRVPVSPALAAAAEARFRRGSLFARRCAREVAGLEARADEAASRGEAGRAAGLRRRAADLSGDPALLAPAGEELLDAGDLAGAESAWRDALARAGDDRRALRATLEVGLGDLAWRGGERAAAAERYRAALGLDPAPAGARLVEARLAALADPAIEAAAAPWLLREGDPGIALARLAGSRAPLARYLLGRAALARGAPRMALRLLADASPLPGAALSAEARRLSAEAACAAGEWNRGASAFEEIARAAGRAADRERAEDAAWRCRREGALYGRAVGAGRLPD